MSLFAQTDNLQKSCFFYYAILFLLRFIVLAVFLGIFYLIKITQLQFDGD